MIELANYSELELCILPDTEPATYIFVLKNHGERTLWGLEMRTYDILGPGDFGLDDTHMPASLRRESSARFERLGASDEVAFTLKK